MIVVARYGVGTEPPTSAVCGVSVGVSPEAVVVVVMGSLRQRGPECLRSRANSPRRGGEWVREGGGRNPVSTTSTEDSS